MTQFENTLKELDEFFAKNKIRYALIGGLAVVFYQSFRTTNDIDITIETTLEDLKDIGRKIQKHFNPLFKNPVEFFEKNFVMPVKSLTNNTRIDFVAALTGFELNVIKRAKRVKFGEVNVWVCSVEDLIIYKLFAGRPQDMVDVQEIIVNSDYDRKYLLDTASEFKELGRADVLVSLKKFFVT